MMFAQRIISRFWKPKQPSKTLLASPQGVQPVLLEPAMPVCLSEVQLPIWVQQSPTAMRYYHFLHPIPWEQFPKVTFQCPNLHHPTPYAPFLGACLVKIDQKLDYMSELRQYLVEHPALIWLLGFPVTASLSSPWGFDADRSLPTARHFTRLLRKIPPRYCQWLLTDSVHLLQSELREVAPDFGEAISLDTKHILAWVKENNPKAYVVKRFDKTRQPAGDPDCKLGCKRRHNAGVDRDNLPQTPTTNPIPAHQVEVGEYYWGYASGVVATKVPEWGEFVLAEFTQTFDRPEVSYFEPLMAQTEQRLGFRPPYGCFDAGFDAFYIYSYFHREGHPWQDGFAAIPFSVRNGRHKTFTPQGQPCCEAGLPMILKYTFTSRTTLVVHERGHYVCPLPHQPDQACPIQHARWAKGGCTHRLPTDVGARLRHQIDRESPLYQQVYKQRTATERVNAQATELGIEQPHLRNQHAILNQNTLIYTVINLRALQRIQHKKADLTLS